MRTNSIGLLILLVTVAMVGCGPQAEKVDAPEITPSQAIKTALEGIAESGQGGSEIGTLLGEIDKLAAEDAALADSLRPDAEAMMNGSLNSDQLKAKAQEMIGKLGGGGGAPAPEEGS